MAPRASLAVAVAVVVAGCSPPEPKQQVVRAVTLRVVDAETDAPLPGIQVLRVVEIERYAPGNPLDPILPAYRETAATTGPGGVVRFPPLDLGLPAHQHLREEVLYVNVDVDPARPRHEDGELVSDRDRCLFKDCRGHEAPCLVTLDGRHLGHVVLSTAFSYLPSDHRQPPSGRYDVHWNGGSLKRPEETLVVRLRRAPAAAAPASADPAVRR